MAVLIEAISVVIKRSVINEKYPRGWEGFVADAPNETLCADGELARVGFMAPDDVESFVNHLKQYDFIYQQDGIAKELVVVDQRQGCFTKCEWLTFGFCNFDRDEKKRVAACIAVDDTDSPLLTPDGWEYEGSLSHTYGYVPIEHTDKSLKFLRHEDGLDVYFNELTGKEAYIGRTGETV